MPSPRDPAANARCLHLVAPFRSGLYLPDAPPEQVVAIGSRLATSSRPTARWHVSSGETRETGLIHGPAGVINEDPLPDAVAAVSDGALAAAAAAWAGRMDPDLRVERAEVLFLTFGVGVLELELSWPDGVGGATAQADLDEAINDVPAEVDEVVRTLTDELLSAVVASRAGREAARSAPIVAPWDAVARARTGLLWVHRVLVQVGGPIPTDIVPPNVQDRLVFADLTYRPGIDWSVIHVHAYREEPTWILRVSRLAQASLALLEDVDRAVFDALVVATRNELADGLPTADVLEVEHFVQQMRLVQARLESSFIALGGATIRVWQVTNGVQSWPHVRANIDANLAALHSLQEATRLRLEAARSRRLNDIALVFTLSGVFATILTAIAFMFGGDLEQVTFGHWLLVLLPLVMMATLGMILRWRRLT